MSLDILNRDIQSSINTFNRKCNEVRLIFPFLIVISNQNLFLYFVFICMDALYGTLIQIMLKLFNTAWRKAIRAIWKLPFRTHCNLFHGINDTPPIDVMLEQRCI